MKNSEPALRKLQLLPVNQRSLMVEAIIRKVKTISSGPAPASPATGTYVRISAGILQKIGTDEQIIEAFGNLSNFGHAEPDAAEILASCKGSAGVKIIEKLAEKRLLELESAINPQNEEERARSNDILIPFYFLILRLDSATNPEGARAAKRLRDQVATRYLSENGKSFVAILDGEMTKARSRTQKDRTNPESLPSKNASDSVKAAEADRPNNYKPVQTLSQEKFGIHALFKVAVITAIILAGTALAWRFMMKRNS